MWKTRLISDGGLSRSEQGFDVDIRLPWYRSLPVSTLRGLSLRLDGAAIPVGDMTLEIGGKPYRVEETEALTEVWWHVLDSGIVRVRHAALSPGRTYSVDVTLSFEIPYVAGAVISSNCVKTLNAA